MVPVEGGGGKEKLYAMTARRKMHKKKYHLEFNLSGTVMRPSLFNLCDLVLLNIP